MVRLFLLSCLVERLRSRLVLLFVRPCLEDNSWSSGNNTVQLYPGNTSARPKRTVKSCTVDLTASSSSKLSIQALNFAMVFRHQLMKRRQSAVYHFAAAAGKSQSPTNKRMPFSYYSSNFTPASHNKRGTRFTSPQDLGRQSKPYTTPV